MSNAIGRIRLLGIAAQPTFGTAATVPSFVLPMLDAPTIETVVTKIRDEAALGSAYGVDAVDNGNRFANIPISVKLDEDQLPILYKQRYDITTVTGSAGVFTHSLAFTNNTNCWYTLFLEDDNRETYVVRDALFDSLNITADQEYIRLEGNAVGHYPVVSTANLTVKQPKTFLGSNANFFYGDYGGAKTAYKTLAFNLNHTFGLSDEGDNFFLGSQDLGNHVLTQDEYMYEFTGLESDRTNYDDFTANTKKHFDFVLTTTRTITGSSVTPQITFNVPVAALETWSEDVPLDQLVKETFGLLALDEVGVTNAPLKITVINNTSSY